MIVLTVLLWIFLILVGLILLTLLILALPIRYDVKATNIGEVHTLVRVRYLFGLVRIRYELKEGKSDGHLKIAWKDILKDRPAHKTTEDSAAVTVEKPDTVVRDALPQEDSEGTSISGLIKIAKKAKEVLTSRRGKTIMKLCMDAFRKLWKALRPYKFKLTGVVGLGDPGSTGMFLGLCSVFAALFKTGKVINLTGDFQSDSVRIEFDLAARGMVSIIRVAVLMIGLAVKKPMRDLIKGYFAKGMA